MSDVVVRAITDDEVRDYLRCVGAGFHMGVDVTDERIEFSRHFMTDLSRRFGAFVDGVLCGTTGSFGSELTVPGGSTVAMGGVTQVTVMPTHRRRGLLREMMDTQLRDSMARAEPVTMLVAAEWPIYGRFGYGMAIEAAATIIDASTAVFVDPTMRGTVEVVDTQSFREATPVAFDRHRLTCPGSIKREPALWDLIAGIITHPTDKPPKGRMFVVHRSEEGDVDGLAIYEPTDDWVHNQPKVKLNVHELIAVNDVAFTDLLKYLCAIDWVTEVHLHVRGVDEDVRHLFVNGRVARQADRSDHMWVRLLDVPAALAARRYETPVSIVLDVRDDFVGDGRFRLEGDAGGATCMPTTDAAEVAVGVDVLGAAYLGGSSLMPYVMAGRVDEIAPGSVATLDRAMHSAKSPWAPTSF
jgi:predicted acetyltransferase